MTHYELATLGAIVIGPISAVGITLWHQARTQKRQAKLQLFLTLMAHRKSIAPPLEWANALNLIDVVYADHSKVVALWHDLYQIRCQKPQVNWEASNQKHLELLSEMAKVLGYRRLQQTDMDKFYIPEGHGNQAKMASDLAAELLRVLKSTERLSVEPRSPEPSESAVK